MLGLVAALVLGLALPTGAFSLVDATRVGAVGVAGDGGAELGMSVSSCVDKTGVNPLVTVTNDLQESVDVTVSLVDPNIGELHAGAQSGDSVTVTLGVGGSNTIDVEATTSGPWPKPFDFTVDASGADTSVSATRGSQFDNCGSSTPTPTATATPVPGNEPPSADFIIVPGAGNKVTVDASTSLDPDGTIVSYEWYVNDPSASGAPDATGQTTALSPVRSGESITLVVTDDQGATDSITKTAP